MSEDYAKEPSRRRRDEDDEPRRRPRDDDDDYGIRRRGSNLADRGSRFVAALIDGLLGALCMIPGIIIIFTSAASIDPQSLASPTAMIHFALAGFVVMMLGLLGYQIGMAFMIASSGQTIGKKAMGIRIVLYENGKLPGVVNGWVLRWLVPFAIGQVPYIGSLFGLVDILFIFGEEKRCIHDLIASTKVVVAEPLREERGDDY